jgi:ABC-type multidrug transport system fused ATPase/permease subunit
MYTITMTVGMLAAGGTLNEIVSAVGIAEKLFEIMDIPNVIVDGNIIADEKLTGEIEFKNVTFSYPTKSDVKVIKNIDMNIRKGQTVAFVGASGSGKSSIISLIERFYDISEGNFLLFSFLL